MTTEQREYLLGKMIDQPQALTDSEVENIMDDEELKGLYETAVLLKQAATPTKTYDVDKEWEMFRPRLVKRRILPSFGRKWAAAVIILLSVGATAAITHMALTERQEPAVEQAESTNHPEKTYGKKHTSKTTVPDEEIRLKEPLTFTNTKLREIAKKTAEVFLCEVKIVDEKKEKTRLYLSLPIGSTIADFVAVIDAYDVLSAELHDGVVTIK